MKGKKKNKKSWITKLQEKLDIGGGNAQKGINRLSDNLGVKKDKKNKGR